MTDSVADFNSSPESNTLEVDDIPCSEFGSNFSDEDSSDGNQEKRKKLKIDDTTRAGNIPPNFSLNISQMEYIGEGSCGKVFKYFYSNEFVALKICDIYNNSERLNQMLQEAHVYEYLQTLQGALIPKLIFHGYMTGIYILATSFVNGHPYTFAEVGLVQKALGILRDHGVEHDDPRPENILIDEQGEVWILDLGLIKFLS
jgi:serine/threonine protein kinase